MKPSLGSINHGTYIGNNKSEHALAAAVDGGTLPSPRTLKPVKYAKTFRV